MSNKKGEHKQLKRITSDTLKPSENISKGIIEANRQQTFISIIRKEFLHANIIPKLIDNVKAEVEDGYNKNAIELIKIIKEPESQDVNVRAAIASVQKVYVTKEQDEEAEEYINNILNE